MTATSTGCRDGSSLFPDRREPPAVNRSFAMGALLTVLGLVGYGLGLGVAYPGRAFSVTLVMVGVALVAMRRAFDGAAEAP